MRMNPNTLTTVVVAWRFQGLGAVTDGPNDLQLCRIAAAIKTIIQSFSHPGQQDL